MNWYVARSCAFVERRLHLSIVQFISRLRGTSALHPTNDDALCILLAVEYAQFHLSNSNIEMNLIIEILQTIPRDHFSSLFFFVHVRSRNFNSRTRTTYENIIVTGRIDTWISFDPVKHRGVAARGGEEREFWRGIFFEKRRNSEKTKERKQKKEFLKICHRTVENCEVKWKFSFTLSLIIGGTTDDHVKSFSILLIDTFLLKMWDEKLWKCNLFLKEYFFQVAKSLRSVRFCQPQKHHYF